MPAAAVVILLGISDGRCMLGFVVVALPTSIVYVHELLVPFSGHHIVWRNLLV
jgi:hypothetical protein